LGFYDWSKTPAKAEALLASPDVHMITITITESGYYLDQAGRLNTTDPVIITEQEGRGPNQSVYAYLMWALAYRQAGTGHPLTVLSCDKFRQNGKLLQRDFNAYLDLMGYQGLARWVDKNVTFLFSMVDRITPPAIPNLQIDIAKRFGEQAFGPVVAENFIQWFLEDNFTSTLPDLLKVASPSTPTSIRRRSESHILNGGHTCLAYLASLAGKHTFDQAMTDPTLAAHFEVDETQEVLPALTLKLPFDKAAYLDQVKVRFKNAAIGDTVERICADGVSKFLIFIRPTLEGCLQQDIIPIHGYAAVASWYVFARCVLLDTVSIDYKNPNWLALEPLLEPKNVTGFVNSPMLWGTLSETYPEFSLGLRHAILEMEQRCLV
jgi:D-arabinitol 4-dehydrogenase